MKIVHVQMIILNDSNLINNENSKRTNISSDNNDMKHINKF